MRYLSISLVYLFLFFPPLLFGVTPDIVNINSTVRIETDKRGRFVVIQPGSDLGIVCSRPGGNLAWAPPLNTDLFGFDVVEFNSRITEGADVMDPTARYLLITKARASDSGFYRCHQMGNKNNYLEVYVFVKGVDPFLKPAVDSLVMGRGFWVPCRASYPVEDIALLLVTEAAVTLYIDGVAKEHLHQRYDPRRGFKLYGPDLDDENTHRAVFKCATKRSSVEFYVEDQQFAVYDDIKFKVEKHDSPSGGFTSIKCSLQKLPRIDVITKHRLEIGCSKCKEKAIITERSSDNTVLFTEMTVSKLTRDDDYICNWFIEKNGTPQFREAVTLYMNNTVDEQRVKIEITDTVTGLPEPGMPEATDNQENSPRNEIEPEKESVAPVSTAKLHSGVIIWFATSLCFALAFFSLVFLVLWRRAKRQAAELALLRDALFRDFMKPKKNVIEDSLLSKLTLDQKVEQFAYNRSFEVDRANLKLGNTLGQGNFGKVRKGQLSKPNSKQVNNNAAENGTFLDVAVKIPRDEGNVNQQKMLAHEVKIMSVIPSHPNVLMLIGAVTKNFRIGEFLVVTEYCHNGNLKDFLIDIKQHPGAFVNELRPARLVTGDYLLPISLQKFVNASQEDSEWASELEANRLLPSRKCLATSDLISFAVQIATGMEYLSDLSCIHRDLAARNILVTKEGVCKISDFGLAKQEPKEYYRSQKTSFQPLPIRWLSPESIGYNTYTQSSDVWSFGILLYEIFSLGGLPYAQYDTSVVRAKVLEGEINKKPQYAHEELYALMQACWKKEFEQRPTFTQCTSFLNTHLKMASPQLLERLDDLLQAEGRRMQSYTQWRGINEMDDAEYANLLLDGAWSLGEKIGGNISR